MSNTGKIMVNAKKGHWFYPLQIEKQYKTFLEQLVSAIIKVIVLEIPRGVKNYTQDDMHSDLQESFEKTVERIDDLTKSAQNKSKWFTKAIDKWSKMETISNVKETLGISSIKYSEEIKGLLDKSSFINSDLIKSLSDDVVNRVRERVKDSLQSGISNRGLMDIIFKSGEVSKGRARLIARDQTAKINGDLTKLRQTELGGKRYFWRTSGDNVVRESHAALNGKVCYWDDSSSYSDSVNDEERLDRDEIGAYKGIPGEDYQCRCTAELIVQDLLEGDVVGTVVPETYEPNEYGAVVPPVEYWDKSIKPESALVDNTFTNGINAAKEVLSLALGKLKFDFPPVPIVNRLSIKTGESGQTFCGMYFGKSRLRNLAHIEIDVGSSIKYYGSVENIALHEISHHVSRAARIAITDPITGATVRTKVEFFMNQTTDLGRTILNSPKVKSTMSAIKALPEGSSMKRHLEYLLEPGELWARSYSQFLLKKALTKEIEISGKESVAAKSLQKRYETMTLQEGMWSEREFQPIYDSFSKGVSIEKNPHY